MDTPGPESYERYTFGEEIAHAVSHGVALLAAIAAAPLLIVDAVRHGDAGHVVGASIFAATIILLYTASTLYHAPCSISFCNCSGAHCERPRKIRTSWAPCGFARSVSTTCGSKLR